MFKNSNYDLDLNWNICAQNHCRDEIHVAFICGIAEGLLGLVKYVRATKLSSSGGSP